jgi:deazaflavin-dependent oxidoreductase (nitroreductase family)
MSHVSWRGPSGRRSVRWVSGDDERTTGRTRVWRFRRLVNRYLNPVMQAVAKRLPGFAVLTHHGRRTGGTYRTPVNVFRRGDTYLFFLTYGSDAQWVRNVLSTGTCSIETRGRVVELVEPELITDPELRPAPALVRFVERRIAGVTQYLRMRAAPSDPPAVG